MLERECLLTDSMVCCAHLLVTIQGMRYWAPQQAHPKQPDARLAATTICNGAEH